MRIEGREMDRIKRAEVVRPTVKNGGTNGTSQVAGKPMVSLSGIGQVMGEALHQVESSPSLQAGRVADLKQQVQSGTYHVDTQVLADRMSQIFR